MFVILYVNHRLRIIHGQRMSFSIEDKITKRQYSIIAEQKVQIFQCFRQVEGLHLVREARDHNVRDCRVAFVQPRMLLEGREDVPAPLAVDGVFCRPVQVEQTLHGFRPMYVVSVVVLLRRQCTNHCLIAVNVRH